MEFLGLRVKKALVIVLFVETTGRKIFWSMADSAYRSTLPSQVPTTFFLEDSLYQCFDTVFARV